MSVKCEQSLDELGFQVWLLYDHPNFKYCTLFISGTELRTDKRTDRQTDRRTDRRTDDPNTRCPRRTFQAGGIKKNVSILPYIILLSQASRRLLWLILRNTSWHKFYPLLYIQYCQRYNISNINETVSHYNTLNIWITTQYIMIHSYTTVGRLPLDILM